MIRDSSCDRHETCSIFHLYIYNVALFNYSLVASETINIHDMRNFFIYFCCYCCCFPFVLFSFVCLSMWHKRRSGWERSGVWGRLRLISILLYVIKMLLVFILLGIPSIKILLKIVLVESDINNKWRIKHSFIIDS